MAEENKEELPKEETPVEEPKIDAPAAESQDEKQEESASKDIDYKAELERVQKSLDKAGKKIRHLEDKPKEPEEYQSGLNAEDINELIDQKVSERVETIEKQAYKPQIELEINRMTDDVNKRKLIEHHYNNSIKSTGNIAQDLENAEALADSRRIKTVNAELKRSLESKQGTQKGTEPGHKPLSTVEPKYSAEVKQFLEKGGFKLNDQGQYVDPDSGVVYTGE